jgi:hypothetical protein
MPAHALVNVQFRRGKGGGNVIVKRLCATQPRQARFNRPELRRKRRACQDELLIDTWHACIKATEGFHHVLELARRDVVVLGLDVLARRFAILEIADIDIARALGKDLMKRSVLQPQGQMANSVSRLKIEAFARDKAAHCSWRNKRAGRVGLIRWGLRHIRPTLLAER